MRNVLTWLIAIQNGFEPGLYPYTAGQVPVGEYDAKLDFKIWAKKTMGISCYFTQITTGKKFQLTVYRQRSDKTYKLENGEIDFTECPVNGIYSVSVGINGKGNSVFEKAKLVQ